MLAGLKRPGEGAAALRRAAEGCSQSGKRRVVADVFSRLKRSSPVLEPLTHESISYPAYSLCRLVIQLGSDGPPRGQYVPFPQTAVARIQGSALASSRRCPLAPSRYLLPAVRRLFLQVKTPRDVYAFEYLLFLIKGNRTG